MSLLASHRQVFVPDAGRHMDMFVPALRMNLRSIKKMSAVARMPADPRGPFIQTGFVQRGLGFGWRFNLLGIPLDEMRHFFRLMPVSLGVAFLMVNDETVLARNRERLSNPETAHENRSYQVPLYRKPLAVAREVLRERGVPVFDIDAEGQTPDQSLMRIQAQGRCSSDNVMRRQASDAVLYSPPPWWQ